MSDTWLSRAPPSLDCFFAVSPLPSPFLRTALLVPLVLASAHSALAQDRTRQARSVDAFTGVEFKVPGTLHLRQGDARSVEVEAPQTVLDRLETVVDDGALEIRSEDDDLFDWFGEDDLDGDELDVYVTAPTIETIGLAGSGRIVGETRIEGPSLSLNVAGSGNLNLELATKRLDVHIAGSGDCTLRGQTDALTTNTAGSGDVRAAELAVRTADVRIAGSGDAELHVTDRLEAQILGSGDVHYRGRPSIELNSLGSGEVQPL